MEYLAILFLFFVTVVEVASACPDVGGKYRFVNEPWNGSLEIQQNDCKNLIVTRKRPVAVSRNFPDGVWTEVQLLRVDDKAYVGYEDSTLRADPSSTSFQKVSWKKGRLNIRHFYGASKTCAGKYAHNRSDCHFTEYSLKRESARDDFSWTQKGLFWVEGGVFGHDIYTLKRGSQKGVSMSMIALNAHGFRNLEP